MATQGPPWKGRSNLDVVVLVCQGVRMQLPSMEQQQQEPTGAGTRWWNASGDSGGDRCGGEWGDDDEKWGEDHDDDDNWSRSVGGGSSEGVLPSGGEYAGFAGPAKAAVVSVTPSASGSSSSGSSARESGGSGGSSSRRQSLWRGHQWHVSWRTLSALESIMRR